MAETGLWIAWGIPTPGRERRALRLLRETPQILGGLRDAGRLERFDIAVLKPQSIELGGFVFVQGSHDQIAALHRDAEFQAWVNLVQMVADRVGIVDAWAGDGLVEAADIYEKAIEQLD